MACRDYKLRFSTVIKWVCCFSWSLMERLYQFDLCAFGARGVNPPPTAESPVQTLQHCHTVIREVQSSASRSSGVILLFIHPRQHHKVESAIIGQVITAASAGSHHPQFQWIFRKLRTLKYHLYKTSFFKS